MCKHNLNWNDVQKKVRIIRNSRLSDSNFFLKKWANPGLFLFIFVLFKYNFTEKL